MAIADQEPEVDTLTHLEERIQRAVALVNHLRQERDTMQKELTETQQAWEESQTENSRMSEELESLRTERRQVRSRLEKLLGHIDQLGAA